MRDSLTRPGQSSVSGEAQFGSRAVERGLVAVPVKAWNSLPPAGIKALVSDHSSSMTSKLGLQHFRPGQFNELPEKPFQFPLMTSASELLLP